MEKSMKKFILISILCMLSNSYVLAQEKKSSSESHNYSLSVTTEQKKQVEDFKSQEANLIKQHNEKIKGKRIALQQKEDALMQEVINSKGNESFTDEQKEVFKTRRSNIKKEAEELSRENSEFMKKIIEQRKDFYKKLKQ